jgi:AcrR family transcriptional regulator
MSKNDRPTRARKHSVAEKPKPVLRAPDIRVRRTRTRLGAALTSLMSEKPFDQITLQEVLERAGVGRSTFYVHFSDKDDLWLTQLEGFLEQVTNALDRREEDSFRVLPVAELLAHIGSQKKLYRTMVDSGRIHGFFDLAEGYFARAIERRLKRSPRTSNLSAAQVAALSYGLAGSLLSQLKWWMDHDCKESPQAMDELFHSMVWKGFQ